MLENLQIFRIYDECAHLLSHLKIIFGFDHLILYLAGQLPCLIYGRFIGLTEIKDRRIPKIFQTNQKKWVSVFSNLSNFLCKYF